jgi:hypothetical protein
LKQIEEENRKHKQLAADLSLDKLMLQTVPRTNTFCRSVIGKRKDGDHDFPFAVGQAPR